MNWNTQNHLMSLMLNNRHVWKFGCYGICDNIIFLRLWRPSECYMVYTMYCSEAG